MATQADGKWKVKREISLGDLVAIAVAMGGVILRREQQAYSIQIQALARIGADTLAPVMAVRSLTCL